MKMRKRRKQLAIILIATLFLCGIGAAKQEIRLFSQMPSDGTITSETSMSFSDQQLVRRERTQVRLGMAEKLQRTSCSAYASFRQLLTLGVLSSDCQKQIFCSSMFLQNHAGLYNASGYLDVIRCVYEKDGKK